MLPSALATATFGNTTNALVHVAAETGASTSATVTLRATSESDPTKTATATCAVTR